ncbi:MAG: GNAT family N-acetyltransferase [Nocardioidaceae bacterium]
MTELQIRPAAERDIPHIVALLADDEIGATRETPADLAPYLHAFEQIEANPRDRLVVADRDGAVVGTLQLTFLLGLSRTGATRAQIEGVRIAAAERGSGLGTQLITWAVEEARRSGAQLVQLTSDATRKDAQRFYQQLGFQPTHVGFKLTLTE